MKRISYVWLLFFIPLSVIACSPNHTNPEPKSSNPNDHVDYSSSDLNHIFAGGCLGCGGIFFPHLWCY